jgi:Antitoxin VbhA
MQHPQFLTAEETRALLEAADRRNAKLRAEYPAAAHVFPPVSDELFRQVMELALLGELRRPPLLPPLRSPLRRNPMTRKRLKRMAAETMDYQGPFTVRDLIENMIAEREWQQQRAANPRADAMTGDDPKPAISAEEMERRRAHVRVAIADSRIEGSFPNRAELEIYAAYIRGEIEAADLVTAYKRRILEFARRA